MSDQTTPTLPPVEEGKPLNRRRLLRVALATAPIIATLPTGAALARSSNLIGPTSGTGLDSQNRLLCLNLNSGSVDGSGIMDLGVSPHPNVTGITDRVYRTAANGGSSEVTEAEMCRQTTTTGTYYYQSTGWNQVAVPKGIVVSATALASFAGSINFTEI